MATFLRNPWWSYPTWDPVKQYSTDFTAFLKGDLDREFVWESYHLDRAQLADDLVRSPDKLATENIFILTVEMHKKVAARSFIFTWVLSSTRGDREIFKIVFTD